MWDKDLDQSRFFSQTERFLVVSDDAVPRRRADPKGSGLSLCFDHVAAAADQAADCGVVFLSLCPFLLAVAFDAGGGSRARSGEVRRALS